MDDYILFKFVLVDFYGVAMVTRIFIRHRSEDSYERKRPQTFIKTNFQRLQHHFHHRVGTQCAVNLVQLLTAGGSDGERDAQVFAAAALAQLDGSGVKRGVKLVRDVGEGVDHAVDFEPHDFDGKLRRVFDQRLFFRDVHGGACSVENGGFK
jgi:hypothetical protein